LARDMVGGAVTLAVTGVVEHEHALARRRNQQIGTEQCDRARRNRVSVPVRLGQEELQALYRSRLCLDQGGGSAVSVLARSRGVSKPAR
jgi:hypothetical protein